MQKSSFDENSHTDETVEKSEDKSIRESEEDSKCEEIKSGQVNNKKRSGLKIEKTLQLKENSIILANLTPLIGWQRRLYAAFKYSVFSSNSSRVRLFNSKNCVPKESWRSIINELVVDKKIESTIDGLYRVLPIEPLLFKFNLGRLEMKYKLQDKKQFTAAMAIKHSFAKKNKPLKEVFVKWLEDLVAAGYLKHGKRRGKSIYYYFY